VGLSTESPGEETEELFGSIGALAMTDPDLSILVQLVTLAGLGEALNTPGPFTVFAPTNDAFAEVITDLDDLESLETSVVFAILQYHVVPGIYMESDITDGAVLTTLMAETIEFDVSDDGVFVNDQMIITTDLVASNGVVHKIDGVMWPQAVLGPETDGNETSVPTEVEEPLGTIAQIGMSSPDLALLIQLVTMAGLGEFLSMPTEVTVFAPTNNAFAEVIADVDDLDNLDSETVTNILLYHVVPGIYMESDFSDGLILGTVLGQTIEFQVNDAGLFVNKEVISTTDLVGSNGVVHKIDGVMRPQAVLGPETDGNETSVPTEVEVPLGTIVDLVATDSDLTILAALATQASLLDTLSAEGPYTVFAPVDASYFALVDQLNGEEYDGGILKELLTYHVVSGAYYGSDITDGLTLDTVQGESIVFGVDGDVVTVNGHVILVADISASNGVIHKIDGVLALP